ncbi:MAG: SAM-dependent methyltransferase [Opitutaceae bacterium]|nr:SAM-dependent methyltransferase [Opitutaceae bacterium]
MPPTSARDRFLDLVRAAVRERQLLKLTLGKYRGPDASLRNVFVRPVDLKAGPHLAFLWRHATRDVTKNHPLAAAVGELERLIGADFLDAHLFTTTQNAQLETKPDGTARLKITAAATRAASATPPSHDRAKSHVISADAGWLRALGVTNDRGQPREGMADKFRQIQKFAELLSHHLAETFGNPAGGRSPAAKDQPLRVVDMGSGKGYLTFAMAALLGDRATVLGIEARPELAELCNRVAQEHGFAPRLSFSSGQIADTPLKGCDVLIALHACDTATDDALAHGIAAGARLLVVAPCCQKELRPQLTAPAVLAEPLRHGIFQERQAEFVTDALRAMLLEWAGFRTRVLEFISTEHTAKNLMITATRARPPGSVDDEMARQIRALAEFFGIRRQRLASALEFSLSAPD